MSVWSCCSGRLHRGAGGGLLVWLGRPDCPESGGLTAAGHRQRKPQAASFRGQFLLSSPPLLTHLTLTHISGNSPGQPLRPTTAGLKAAAQSPIPQRRGVWETGCLGWGTAVASSQNAPGTCWVTVLCQAPEIRPGTGAALAVFSLFFPFLWKFGILERTLEPDSSDEEPPPVYSPPAYHMHVFDRPYPLAPPTPPPRIDVLGSGAPTSQRRYRNWNPPLLGNLPDDFLRILPQQLDSIQGNAGGPKPGSGEGGPPAMAGPGPRDQESRWKQYLEDERIALFLQNEEFMKELQRNRDFLLALERDRLKYESQKSKSSSVAVGNDFGFPSPVPGTGDANPAVSEDALFRDKLKHMGKYEDFRGRHQEAPKVEEGLREGQ
ncbi:CUE domain-containing protein 1 isoform X4 [Pongo pygmaeus]|uniref:CUE domain-containing protein 1 isoform X4 n=1 Tax=Pongo pygmaeus TaxID=9600 RepID=UPI00300D583A